MAKQVMVMIVVDDDWFEDDESKAELERTLQDVLVYKHDVAVLVEDFEVTVDDYDWKKANGYNEED